MSEITIRGARLHNLKNISFSIPKNKLVVFTGVSGSGKSTMAFDTLHKEGQRQYMESLGMVTYESRPAVDAIIGLSPSISVDQRNRNRSPRSTVGTASEAYTYLRVLFARTGHRPCPTCGADTPPAHRVEQAADSPAAWDDDDDFGVGEEPFTTANCPNCGAALPEMGMAFFSFNKPAGACPACTGLGTTYTANLALILDEEKSLSDGAVLAWDPHLRDYYLEILRAAGRYYGCTFDPAAPVRALSPAQRDLLLYGAEAPAFRRHYPDLEPPETVARGRFEGVVTNLLRRRADHANDEDAGYLEKLERLLVQQPCPECSGTRLRPEARLVTVAGRTIVEVSRLPLSALAAWIAGLSDALPDEDRRVVEPVVTDLQERLRRLVEIGLGYLTLERASPSLSAGEAQRLRLAALLGSGLTGVLYVLDEPTIGMHASEVPRLVKMLRALRDLGNTVLVIEHDLELIAAADWLVDFGPGGGRLGGRIVAEGTPSQMAQNPASLTGQFLSGSTSIAMLVGLPASDHADDLPRDAGATTSNHTDDIPRKVGATRFNHKDEILGEEGSPPSNDAIDPPWKAGATLLSQSLWTKHRNGSPLHVGITIHGAREHNLKDITVFFPRGVLIAVSGVSGSGKSSLIFDILERAARQRYAGASVQPGAHTAIAGWEHFDRVIAIDQAPLGRSTRSNAATYTDAFTAIREVYAAQASAHARGLTARHFSFNLPGGRCERCEGAGTLTVEMHFLPDVQVRCPVCHGRRFKREVLAVKYKGCDIAQALDLTIAEALVLFADVPAAEARLGLMAETGMGYLQLGQPASTFSGGEAQRVKLAKELARGAIARGAIARGGIARRAGSRLSAARTLYLLDEPTTGLHPADAARLILLLQRLVAAGATIIVVEHNLDVIKCADWVIDLGPGGGDAGGWIVAAGAPEAIAACPASLTGQMLKNLL